MDNARVVPFDSLDKADFESRQGQNILEYLRSKSAVTSVVEPRYIDKDFLIDYQTFYSRSFKDVPRTTKRVHFFSRNFDQREFDNLLSVGNLTKDQIDSLGYLGFTLIKPVNDIHNKPLIGRTVLQPPHPEDNTHHFVRVHNNVSLCGINLGIDAVPFQAQDGAVGACATIALWTALHPLAGLLGLQSYSQAEITSRVTFFPSEQRVYPSDGLTLMQMLTFIRSANPNVDVEVINVEKENTDSLFLMAIKAYINANLASIATLQLTPEKGASDLHANVIVGYESDDNGKIQKLFIHDDQISPYSVATPGEDGNFKTLSTKWADQKMRRVVVEKLLVPVYTKMRVDFIRASTFHKNFMNRRQVKETGSRADLLLYRVQEYKGKLLNESIEDKLKNLGMFMPHFLWIIRSYAENEKVIDEVLDATSTSAYLSSTAEDQTNPNLVTKVTYK